MNKPFLFIETPRAGKHNHRFITPTNYNDGDSLLSQFADTARQQAEAKANEAPKSAEAADTIISTTGIYFLATGKEASQTSGGRIGWEQLILVNVDVKRLSPEKIANINFFLQQHLKEVERLVTETIDWNKIDTIMVPREELNQWLKELELEKEVGTLPAIKQPTKLVIKQPTKPVIWIIAAMIGLVCIVIALNDPLQNLYNKNKGRKIGVPKTNYQEQRANAELEDAKKQAERLIAAIGEDEDKIKSELETSFGLYNSDTWKNSQAGKIPATGDWQLAWFTSSLYNAGRDLASLWGPPIENLVIKDKDSALQPLVQCRIAIRKWMGIEEAVYTPFFNPEDFGDKAVVTMKGKITTFAKNHEESIKQKRGCEIKPNPKESLLDWIKGCFNLTGYKDDKELQNIKKVGEQCGKVQFISPTVSNTGTIKK